MDLQAFMSNLSMIMNLVTYIPAILVGGVLVGFIAAVTVAPVLVPVYVGTKIVKKLIK